MILFVVDSISGPTSTDFDVAELLRQTDKPVILAANKADNLARSFDAVEFYQLGMGELSPSQPSTARAPATSWTMWSRGYRARPRSPRRSPTCGLAIVGRPNVGKSSLVNVLAGEHRVMVSEIPGTTRDAVDTMIRIQGQVHPAGGHRRHSPQGQGGAGHREVQRHPRGHRPWSGPTWPPW